ncbi:hypothetical protein OIU77_023956 [Salix suchowensis]|uniref:TF-B3 domain-containing protein n=1 Tax=Salix suchowensis TaxID=1278906 RepID=A0ABQ9C5N6_9ROSI|nr:hypothetical protein OIU77_023956 [Salix suchowensis]
MQIFNKQLTRVDIDRQLVLPNNTRAEALPFQGTRDIVIPITFGHDGVEVDVHCSCRAGHIAFTRGWVEIARNLSFNAGDFRCVAEGRQWEVQNDSEKWKCLS